MLPESKTIDINVEILNLCLNAFIGYLLELSVAASFFWIGQSSEFRQMGTLFSVHTFILGTR